MTIKHGYLADYFESFGYKRLKPVEVDPSTSNEHEFNGVNKFKDILGTEKIKFSCKVIYLSDDEDEIIQNNITLTRSIYFEFSKNILLKRNLIEAFMM